MLGVTLRQDVDARVRAYATDALSRKGEAAVGPLIEALKTDADARVRAFAGRTLDGIGAPAIEPLIAILQDMGSKSRREAALALTGIAFRTNNYDTRAGNALLAALRKSDMEVITCCYHYFVKRGEPGLEEALIAALHKNNDKEMAEYLANSENAKLQGAGRKWAPEHGYCVKPYLSPEPCRP